MYARTIHTHILSTEYILTRQVPNKANTPIYNVYTRYYNNIITIRRRTHGV
jgi:hypothetical protein